MSFLIRRVHLRKMSCISLPKQQPSPTTGETQAEDPVGWAAIIRGVRLHAVRQPPELAAELLDFADFLAGKAELQERKARGAAG